MYVIDSWTKLMNPKRGNLGKNGLEGINDYLAEAPSRGSNDWHLAWNVNQPFWALILATASKSLLLIHALILFDEINLQILAFNA